jgi:hypothetical protein
MPHSSIQLLVPVLAGLTVTMSGCSPPPELTASQEALVGRCLELAHKQETDSTCEVVTEPMREAFLAKHPDFYEQLLAARKKFVEDRIAEDMRRRDELNLCLDDREARNASTAACEQFMPHEIARATEDRRRRRCAASSVDGKADASQRCEGLSKQDIEDEVQMERGRRERRR